MSEITIRLIAVGFGVSFGLFVVSSIVLTYKLGGHRSSMGRIGVVGGLVIAFGFAVLRTYMAEDRHDILLPISLAAAEIGVILVLEWIGTHQRRIYAEWRTQKTAFDQKADQLAAAESEEGKRFSALKQTRVILHNHIQYVDERLIRRVKAPELEDAAVRTVRDGYLAGIDFNRSRVQSA
jgi:hypothetical protein